MLQAIIFDIDETLLDWRGREISWEDHEWKHLGRVFDYVNEHVHPLDNREYFYEATLASIVEHWGSAKRTLQAPHLGQVLVEVLVSFGVPPERITAEACIDAYQAEPIPGVQLFPDVLPELKRLQSYKLKLGLVTNALQPMRLRHVELEALGLVPFFKPEHSISAADVGYLKPHPHIFERILSQLEVAPHEAVLIGDSLRADISGAQQAGIKAILRERVARLGYKEHGDTSQIVPDGVVSTLADIYPLLDEWFPGWRGAER